MAAATVAAVLALTGGCGGEGGESSAPGPLRQYFDMAVKAGADDQAAVLADGEVTFGEYEAGMFAYKGCLEAAGIRVDGPTPNPVGVGLGLILNHDGASPDDVTAIDNECNETTVKWIQLGYGVSTADLEAQATQQLAERVVACAKSAGIDVPAGLGLPALHEAMPPEVFSDCMAAAIGASG